jgi:hypothetical protein
MVPPTRSGLHLVTIVTDLSARLVDIKLAGDQVARSPSARDLYFASRNRKLWSVFVLPFFAVVLR